MAVLISGFVPVDEAPEESLLDKTPEQANKILDERRVRYNAQANRIAQEIQRELRALRLESMPLGDSPTVIAELTPIELKQIAHNDFIQDIALLENEFAQRLYTRRATRYVNTVQNRNITSTQKVDGTGIIIGVLEVASNTGGANIYDPLANGPTLPPPLSGARISLDQNVTGCPTNDHGARMVGHIVSQSSSVGFSPKSIIYLTGSCNSATLSSDYRNRTNGLIMQGARVISASSGMLRSATGAAALDRDVDRSVYNSRITFVHAAGNDTSGYIDAPSYGYNVISVGAYDDRGTMSETDAARASFSSWRDPPSAYNDRTKPDLAAPGVNISGVTVYRQPNNCFSGACQYFKTGSGTSDATAFVSGIVGLMMHRNNRLIAQPEAVKAILLTSAVERFSGSIEYTGAGGVFADYADNIAQNYVSGRDASALMNGGAKGGVDCY